MQLFCPTWASRLKGTKLPCSAGLFANACITRIHYSNTKFFPLAPNNHISARWSSSAASPERAFEQRLQEVKETCSDPYPRLRTSARSISISEFRTRYNHISNEETVEQDFVVINGRIRTARLAGNKLIFFDIIQNGHKIQVMCEFRQLEGVTPADFKSFYRLLRRGDSFSVTGRPHRTKRGELTVKAIELPQLLSPCLHDIPLDAKDHESSPYARHVQFLANQKMVDIIRARSAITQYIREFFLNRSFMEVSTPILNSIPGGAIARPFYTSATEFSDRRLSLRIAPELWLKRLVVGGFDKVFEIGPSFRNEGLDKTHNPEFTTCEFYQAYANMDDLMTMTEELLSGISNHISDLNKDMGTLTPTRADFTAPFRRVDFISVIEEKIGRQLPDLTALDAVEQITQLFHTLSLKIPSNPNLPRLMDELSSIYLEPECINPTFIINPPECLSPLSKSFIHPITNQRVAARGELFIEGKEVVNTYEEENSPFEQRRKFEDQLRFSKDANEPGEVDEEYLAALEWGLPSTGGWGCGIDRLCMLFTGAKRIADVLPFGNLRSVTRR